VTVSNLPAHIAIIMDGNGRWAVSRGYPRFYGHIRGAARVREIVRECRTLGVRALTLYAFSTENWKRPEDELSVLWTLLRKYIRREVAELKKNGIRLRVIGEWTRLPEEARRELVAAMEMLADGKEMDLVFALSYGSRAEITDAIRKIASDCERGILKASEITESTLESRLWTSELGAHSDVDFMIRTSGEQRLSNFLLWQCSYAEFDFPETLWPEYTVSEFRKSLERYGARKRRFGGI
jgi:undecaprenyl diphosphate synthase